MMPDARLAASLPGLAVDAMTGIHSAWMAWLGQAAQTSQEILQQTARQQRRLAADAMQGWMEHNARVMRITARMGVHPAARRAAAGPDDRRMGR